MTHDLEMNFNKIAPFGKEDTAKELQDHAAQMQNDFVDAVEQAKGADIKSLDMNLLDAAATPARAFEVERRQGPGIGRG